MRKIPAAFYHDHVDRELPAPPAIKRSGAFVWIDTKHPDYPELVADARHYADADGPDPDWYTRAAKSMLRALGEAFDHVDRKRIADRVDGFDRDDLGESPDY